MWIEELGQQHSLVHVSREGTSLCSREPWAGGDIDLLQQPICCDENLSVRVCQADPGVCRVCFPQALELLSRDRRSGQGHDRILTLAYPVIEPALEGADMLLQDLTGVV